VPAFLRRRAKHNIAVLCALVKDATALVELDDLRIALDQLHKAIDDDAAGVVRVT
jgi:hypothetical protein